MSTFIEDDPQLKKSNESATATSIEKIKKEDDKDKDKPKTPFDRRAK